MIAPDRSSTDPWERGLAALPPWIALMWLLGLGGFAAIRDPDAPAPTWPQKLWALAWAWLIFGGFFLIVAWLGVAFVWFAFRVGLVMLAAVLTVAYGLTRLMQAVTTSRRRHATLDAYLRQQAEVEAV